ncbi:type 1 glutamine amidotransferase domain-containing protein [bacterium]|nr:type 1 glutamine amidotransferase domain-containing protein [bacterium]
MKKKKILIVLTKEKIFNKEYEFNVWLNETIEFYDEITKLGYKCLFASLNKLNITIDQYSLNLANKIERKWIQNKQFKNILSNSTKHLKELNPDEFSAIFLAGGYGAFNDYYKNNTLNKFLLKLYENNAYICTCSRGLIALLNLKNNDGKHLLYKRKLTAMSNEEERLNLMIDKLPFLLENKLRMLKVNYIKSLPYYEHVIQDEQFISAQNPQSSRKLAIILNQNLMNKA